jgi:hypothetical protein
MVNLTEKYEEMYEPEFDTLIEYLEQGYTNFDEMAYDASNQVLSFGDLWRWADKDTNGNLYDCSITKYLEQLDEAPKNVYDLFNNAYAYEQARYFDENRESKLAFAAVYYLVKVKGVTEMDEVALNAYIQRTIETEEIGK